VRLKTVFFILTACLTAAGAAGAQTVQAFTDSETTYTGQSVGFTIRITGSEKAERPDLRGFDEFRVQPAGESTSIRSSFGTGSGSGKSVSVEYRWLLTPLAEGSLTIPSVSVQAGDRVLKTRAGQLHVRPPGPLEGYHLFLTAEGDHIFPGLPVRVTLKWLFSSQVSQPDLSIPFLDQPGVGVEDLPAPSGKTGDIFQLSVNGRTVYASQSAEIYEGEQYASLTMGWNLYPEETGTLNLEPVILAFQRGVSRDRWGNARYEPAVIPSNSLQFSVQEVPRELEEFPGGVLVADDVLAGDVALSQTRLYPGDPLEVTLRLKGLSVPEMTGFRGIGGFPELQEQFRSDPGSMVKKTEEGDLVVSQTLRVRSAGTEEFPSLSFLYYNRKNGKIESFNTLPIPLDVVPLASGGESSGFGMTQGGSGSEGPGADSAAGGTGAAAGIPFHSNENLTDLNRSFRSEPPLLLLLILPPIIWLVLALVRNGSFRGLLRMGRTGRKETRLLYRECIKGMKALRNGGGPGEARLLYDALVRWLTAEFRLPPGPEGAEEMIRRLEDHLEEPVAGETGRFLRKLEEFSWTGENTEMPDECLNYRLDSLLGGSRKRRVNGAAKLFRPVQLFLLLLFLIPQGYLTAEPVQDRSGWPLLLEEADAAFRTALEGEAVDFGPSVSLYLQALSAGAPEDPRLLYNLGNALALAGRDGYAAAAYEKALYLRPGYDKARTNLHILQDRADLEVSPPSFPRRILFGALYLTGRQAALYIGIILFWLSWAAAGTALFTRFSLRPVFAALLILSLYFLVPGVLWKADGETRGIVTGESAVLRVGDSRAYETAGADALSPGQSFRALEKRSGWVLAELPGGEQGWLEEADVRYIAEPAASLDSGS